MLLYRRRRVPEVRGDAEERVEDGFGEPLGPGRQGLLPGEFLEFDPPAEHFGSPR
jgi:hypothetical protein